MLVYGLNEFWVGTKEESLSRDDVYRRHGIFGDFWHYLVCKSTVSQLDHDPAS